MWIARVRVRVGVRVRVYDRTRAGARPPACTGL